MSTDLAVIEAALKAATPGPWRADNNDVWTADGDRFISAPVRIADANLIANAPTWLAELVERVKVAEAERDGWHETAIENETIADDYRRHAEAMTDRWRKAEAAIERVRAAVERAEARGGGYAGILHGSEILRALDGDA